MPAKPLLLSIGLMLTAMPSLAQAPASEPVYKLDGKGNVVSISNLAPGLECLPDRLDGHVVKRAFDDRGTLLQSFVLEDQDGAREFINVQIDQLSRSSMVTSSHVVKGLQLLVREGRHVDIRAQRCGAAGQVLYLDGIISSRE